MCCLGYSSFRFWLLQQSEAFFIFSKIIHPLINKCVLHKVIDTDDLTGTDDLTPVTVKHDQFNGFSFRVTECKQSTPDFLQFVLHDCTAFLGVFVIWLFILNHSSFLGDLLQQVVVWLIRMKLLQQHHCMQRNNPGNLPLFSF